ncbi:MAG: hypothetical protein AAGL49_05670 [Pseudomonadota bacterium]
MAYAAKKGFQSGELGVTDFFGFAVSSALGVLAAVATDFFQKGDSSAIFSLNVFLNETLGQSMPLWWVMLALVVIGAGAVFIFEPTTRSGAFSMGVGLLAAMMTALPVNNPGGISSASFLSPVEHTPSMTGGSVIQASYLTQVQGAQGVQLTMTIDFPDGLPEDLNSSIRKGQLRGRLHDQVSGQTWSLFRTAGGSLSRSGDRLIIRTAVPASGAGDLAAQLHVRIECSGYEILQAKRDVRRGERMVSWNVAMKTSSQPLFLQRLRTPYSF